ncbi:hypothetical protein BDW75DRAFT_53704 [Aspergillus navahoensis]
MTGIPLGATTYFVNRPNLEVMEYKRSFSSSASFLQAHAEAIFCRLSLRQSRTACRLRGNFLGNCLVHSARLFSAGGLDDGNWSNIKVHI